MAEEGSVSQELMTSWVNAHLSKRDMKVEDLCEDFKDGVKLINTIEEITGKAVGRYNKNPRMITQFYDNTSVAFNFLKKDGMTFDATDGTDITDGNAKLTLGFVWQLMEHYLFGGKPYAEAKLMLLEWIQNKIPEYNIESFVGKHWNDGKALLALCDAISPGLYPDHAELTPSTSRDNVVEGLGLAEQHYFIPKLLSPEQFIDPHVTEPALVCYLAPFMQAKPVYVNQARRTKAEGEGVKGGRTNRPCPFRVITPGAGSGTLVVEVTGPETDCVDPATVTDNGDGTYAVSYTPKQPGEYLITVTLDGENIRGSVFKVTVADSLAASCTAQGKGVATATLHPVGFRVKTPSEDAGKVGVVVQGPDGEDVASTLQGGEGGNWTVFYLPVKSGAHKVSVTLDDEHIPGSPFSVSVSMGDVQWD